MKEKEKGMMEWGIKKRNMRKTDRERHDGERSIRRRHNVFSPMHAPFTSVTNCCHRILFPIAFRSWKHVLRSMHNLSSTDLHGGQAMVTAKQSIGNIGVV